MPAPAARDLIDLVNDHDQVIGSVRRDQALRAHTAFRVVHVLVFSHNGDLLLQRIGKTHTRAPGKWGSSAAGYLYAGEAPLDGAARRLAEETSIQAPLQFVGRVRMNDEEATKFIYVYRTDSDDAKVVDRGHVAQLLYRPVADVARELEEHPDAFTTTFPSVFSTIS